MSYGEDWYIDPSTRKATLIEAASKDATYQIIDLGYFSLADMIRKAGGSLTGALNYAPAVTIASNSAIDIASANSNTIFISGTNSISSLGSGQAGMTRKLRFLGATPLVNSGNLLLPASSNLTTEAGDTAEFYCNGGNSWTCVDYTRLADTTRKAQISATDSTSGRLLTVGAFGLGNLSTINAISNLDSTTTPAGIYSYQNSVSTGTKPSGSGFNGQVLHERYNNYICRQIWTDVNGGAAVLPRTWVRTSYNADTWGDWVEVQTSLNVQTSLSDATAGRLLTVGAFGLGSSAVLSNDWNALTVSGIYRNSSGSAVGIPVSGRTYTMIHMGQSSTDAWQMATETYSSTPGTYPTYIRVKESNVWTDWREVQTSANVQASPSDSTSGRLLTVGAFGLGGFSISEVTDFNNISVNGFYYGSGAANNPAPGVAIVVIHQQYSAGWGSQIATRVSDHRIWMRYKSNGVWSEWAGIFNSQGANLVTSESGSIGYGSGGGGSVVQATDKTTAVTLNKPTGRITTAVSALAAGASATFTLNNSYLTANDVLGLNLVASSVASSYRIEVINVTSGAAAIRITNVSAGSRSDVLALQFVVIKGSIN
jgi:hypothetical protein